MQHPSPDPDAQVVVGGERGCWRVSAAHPEDEAVGGGGAEGEGEGGGVAEGGVTAEAQTEVAAAAAYKRGGGEVGGGESGFWKKEYSNNSLVEQQLWNLQPTTSSTRNK